MKDYHSKEVKLITSQARQFLKDVNEYGINNTGNGVEASIVQNNMNKTGKTGFTIDSFRLELEDDMNVFNQLGADDFVTDCKSRATLAGDHNGRQNQHNSKSVGPGGIDKPRTTYKKNLNAKVDDANGLVLPLAPGSYVTGLGYENPRDAKSEIIMVSKSEDTLSRFNVELLKELSLNSTKLLSYLGKEIGGLLNEDCKFIKPFVQKSDRKEGSDIKYYMQVI